MLEKDFNELDNDFITLWSRFILDCSYDEIKIDIEKLAELGQINAVANYYLMLNEQDESNENIDNLVESLKGENFNEVYAIAQKLRNVDDDGELSELADEFEIAKEDMSGHIKDYEGPAISIFMKELIERTCEIEFVNLIRKSVNMAKEKNKDYRESICLESALEMLEEKNLKVFEDNKKREKIIKETKKKLVKDLKKNPNSASCEFALAKNVVMFEGKEKQVKWANASLKNFASRPLSKTLTNYELKGKTNYHSDNQEKSNEKDNNSFSDITL